MATRDGDFMKAAKRMWEMLDHLSYNNTEKYKKFVKQQLEEGREAMAVPEPNFCLRCSLNGSGMKYRYLFINVCTWARISKPKTDQDPIPVKGGVLRHLICQHNKRATKDLLYDIALNPSVIEECCKDKQLMEMLVSLCLDYVENEAHVMIADRTSCKKVQDVRHQGSLNDMRGSIDEQWKDQLTPGSRLIMEPASMLSKLKKQDEATLPGLKLFPSQAVTHEREIITTHQGQETGRDEVISRTENTKDGGERGVEGPVSHLQIPHPLNSQGRTLIEELSSEVFASYDAVGGKQICNPEHTVIVIGGEELVKGRGGGGGDNDGDRGRRDVVKVTIKLPGVQDVKDVDLDVSESDMELDVSGKYHLYLKFPKLVNDKLTRATLNSKHSELTIIAPCQ